MKYYLLLFISLTLSCTASAQRVSGHVSSNNQDCVGYALDTIPTVKLKSVLDTKSTPIYEPASEPKYTYCVMIDNEDLCRQPWVQETKKKSVHYKNTYSFSATKIRHIIETYMPFIDREDYQLNYYLSDTIDETFDSSKVQDSKTKGCYIHIEKVRDGKYLGTLVLGIAEFEPGKKMVLQRGTNNYFTWYAKKDIETSKSILSSIDISKRDSILGEIAYTQIKKEIPQEITRFKYSYQHNSTVEKKVASKDFSPIKNLYVKQGETYYIVTLPHDDWEKDGFDWDYFAKVWILDTGKPYKFRYGLTGIGRGCKK